MEWTFWKLEKKEGRTEGVVKWSVVNVNNVALKTFTIMLSTITAQSMGYRGNRSSSLSFVSFLFL